ncbi:MAG TPA: beta-ketoacyl-[acyl-carrier-protein] synthase family protein [Ktedonobacteraceae bacterium]|jgi:3-oxoacyl-(acyl-carrier-protein) synthase
MTNHAARRVVITGLGVVAANGIGKEAFWDATSQGISGIQRISRFSTTDVPISVGGEVNNFVVSDYIDRKLMNRTDRSTHYALAAVQQAVQDAKLVLTDENRQRVGIVIASTLGGAEYVLQQLQAFYTRGLRAMSAYTAIAWLQVANVGQTSIRYGIQGYCKTPTHDAVGGLDALVTAYKAIRRGVADVIITGGCEGMLESSILLTFAQGGDCISTDDPNTYRPFDQRAAGLILGEGAGICILEDYEHARQRGVPIYGEVVGFGQTNSADGLSTLSSDGRHYARAIRLAMQEGDVNLRDIGYFSLDGRALPAADQEEAEALRLVFGNDVEQLPVSVPRTMLGHSYGAVGAIDAITALLALRHRLIPPTINCEELNPDYGLNLVQKEARPFFESAVLIGGRGVGGANVVLAIKAVKDPLETS